jgi:hypothetical protein
MATKKMKPKKTNKSKVLRKAKKLEATKPLAVDYFLKVNEVGGE